ncbi:hypothetical protein BDV96DRAFT_359311 [Lophiotrema nucula]|uniref:Serum paraoxonase/arylesteras-like protein n=1 Tax=Lophiotrema nucula TaxID=690887 RepID=A0A6A5YEY3_9PLEO|nr:hypothetical protein BDV96DRAFT_359311 [Lophiotrema nucula]
MNTSIRVFHVSSLMPGSKRHVSPSRKTATRRDARTSLSTLPLPFALTCGGSRGLTRSTKMFSIWRSALGAVALAILYQWWFSDNLFAVLKPSVSGVAEPIEKFPYECRTLKHKHLEACGDLWLDDKKRILYAACAGLEAREQWNPSLSRLNVSGRRAGGSTFMAMYIDQPKKDGLFKMHKIQPGGYGMGPGDGHLDLSGFDAQEIDDSIVRFWFLNQRPPYDTKGKLLSAVRHGANTTIDVYELKRGERKMSHIVTGHSPTFVSPNKIAIMGFNNFAIGNDRSAKTGLLRKFDAFRNSGSILYHDDWSDRYIKTGKVGRVPGMMVRGNDERVYVPSQVDGTIRIFELTPQNTFEQTGSIEVGMPIASLTIDSEGVLWAVGRSKYDPTGRSSSNAIFKIEQDEEKLPIKYTATKVLEDRDREVLQAASVARHDQKTKRIMIAGTYAPGITVCEPRT